MFHDCRGKKPDTFPSENDLPCPITHRAETKRFLHFSAVTSAFHRESPTEVKNDQM